MTEQPDWNKVEVHNGWLVYNTGEHDCAGGTPEASYMHEAHCGYEPIAEMDEVWEALIRVGKVIPRTENPLFCRERLANFKYELCGTKLNADKTCPQTNRHLATDYEQGHNAAVERGEEMP